jgi:hypothetical protein
MIFRLPFPRFVSFPLLIVELNLFSGQIHGVMEDEGVCKICFCILASPFVCVFLHIMMYLQTLFGLRVQPVGICSVENVSKHISRTDSQTRSLLSSLIIMLMVLMLHNCRTVLNTSLPVSRKRVSIPTISFVIPAHPVASSS